MHWPSLKFPPINLWTYPKYQQSAERLVHFQCSYCDKWWTIGDPPEKDYWYCPWCGTLLRP